MTTAIPQLAAASRPADPVRPSPSGLAFAAQTTVATLLALFIAMWLELGTPRWSAWTVFIVSVPTRGGTGGLRKTFRSWPSRRGWIRTW